MTSLRIRRCAAVVKMHPDDRDRDKRQEEKNRNVVVGRSVMMMRLDFESTARETLEAPGKNRAKVISKLVVDYSSCSFVDWTGQGRCCYCTIHSD